MKDLKHKTIYGLAWNFIERFFNYFFQFVVGIILARLLSPKEFGLMGMLAVFISLGQLVILSGLNSALLRKKNITSKEYNSVFVFNISISFLLFILFLILSGSISSFYGYPILKPVLIALSMMLIIEAFSNIFMVRLQHEMDFKLQAKIAFVASLLSGVLAIVLAVKGYGVWSLVGLHLSRVFVISILVWLIIKWKPGFQFHWTTFKELYAFSKKLFLGSFIEIIYSKGFYLLIGKIYAPVKLGFFNRADRTQELLSNNISGWLVKVSYPMLAKIEGKEALTKTYKRFIKNAMFITFILLLGLGAVSENFIVGLLGAQWEPTIIYLQLMVFVGLFLPIEALTYDLFKIFGRSDYYLRLVLIKKAIAIPVLIYTAFISVKFMIVGMITMAILSYAINVYWTSKFINYTVNEQLFDFLGSFIVAFLMSFIVFFIGSYLHLHPVMELIVQIIAGFALIVLYGEFFNSKIYQDIKLSLFILINKKM